MSYRTPNSVCFPIDTENSDRDSCASGRPSALGITAKAINSAVERNEYPVDVYHTDGTHIAVSDRISPERHFIRIFRRLLYRSSYLYVFFIDASITL